MSTCTKWVDETVISCKNWAEQLDHQCTTWADEGSNQCSGWADEGSNKCSDWSEKHCHWYSPWNCIAGWFCQAWYWVAKWVCKGWYWVAKWVCKAFAWVVKAVCTVWGWVIRSVCVAWNLVWCFLTSISRGITNLFSGKKRSTSKIEHVFVLMMENRSFDHMLGFSRLKGKDAITGLPREANGANINRDKNLNPDTGVEVAVSTPADLALKDIDKDPSHEFKNVLTQLCGDSSLYDPSTGHYPTTINNSGFIKDYKNDGANNPDRIMHCFTKEQLPVLNKLAEEFAVCDNWFSSLPGPTWPNRFFLMAATSGGLDDSPSSFDTATSVGFNGYRFANGNIFDLLDSYCIDWRIFEGDKFPVSFALNGMWQNELQGRFKDFDDFESELNKPGFGEKFVFIEPQYGEHEFDITGPGDFVCGNSMHPLDDVTRGEKLIKKVYETIRNSPHWEKSMLLITFDEHGGFYDHVVPPPAIPPGDLTTIDYVVNNFKFDRLGVRVPALVISPLIKKGIIDNTEYDHTSCLATVERLFGMKHLTNRDKNANDFLHLFSLDTPRTDTPAILPDAHRPELSCEDNETIEKLITLRSKLILAQEEQPKGDIILRQKPASNTQIGFAYVALLKVLHQSKYPEREKWKEEFKNLQTKTDAARFMTEAKIKIFYGLDVHRADDLRTLTAQ